MADVLNWAPGGRALISRSRKHIEFDGNKKAPTEVRALGLVQVAGADLRLASLDLDQRSAGHETLVSCFRRISLRIHLLSAISAREMTKIGIEWLNGSVMSTIFA